jgi:hypothetical protein
VLVVSLMACVAVFGARDVRLEIAGWDELLVMGVPSLLLLGQTLCRDDGLFNELV